MKENIEYADFVNLKSNVPSVVTGTRAYGPHDAMSDIDIVMNAEDALKLRDWLIENDVEIDYRNEYSERPSFYFRLNDALCFNIILASCQSEFDRWKRATELMRFHGPVDNRDRRITVFREFFNGKKE